jgi:hypothetical protein
MASRRLPGPLSLRFITTQTFPPLPPAVNFPKPSAPGNASGWDADCNGEEFCCAQLEITIKINTAEGVFGSFLFL